VAQEALIHRPPALVEDCAMIQLDDLLRPKPTAAEAAHPSTQVDRPNALVECPRIRRTDQAVAGRHLVVRQASQVEAVPFLDASKVVEARLLVVAFLLEVGREEASMLLAEAVANVLQAAANAQQAQERQKQAFEAYQKTRKQHFDYRMKQDQGVGLPRSADAALGKQS